jgi:23S rRNA G2069 N7-methylase RlmK/C1962 C5-methylase RlmI
MLATFSCSNFIDEDLFYKIVLAAARDAGADLQLYPGWKRDPTTPFYWDILRDGI